MIRAARKSWSDTGRQRSERGYRPPYHHGVGPDGSSSFLQSLCMSLINHIGIVTHKDSIEQTVMSPHTEAADESRVKYSLHAIIPITTLINVIQPQGIPQELFLFLLFFIIFGYTINTLQI